MKMNDKERVESIVSKLEPELKKLAHDIHDNPELGMKEFKACQWQKTLLSKYGFEIEENYCDMPTSYKAHYKGKKSGPKIAMLAEYDALPGLGHGCGHNLIAMVSVGSGIAMREFADEYGGEIYVIGTPAEETAGSKVAMSRKGAFKDMDVVMMAHPAYANIDSLNTMAINAYKFEFFGKSAHAAGAPQDGLNSLDAVINFFNMVNAMRQQLQDDARIHGVITDGGVAPNIIPEYTSALFYVRANKVADVLQISERVINCAKGAALGTGTRMEVSKAEEDFKDTCSNMALSNLACGNVEAMGGGPIIRLHGQHIPGSSDLGDVSYECPAIQLSFCIGVPEDGNIAGGPHTENFARDAGTEPAMDNGLTFIKGFVMTAIDLMTKPEYLETIKEEFTHVADPQSPIA